MGRALVVLVVALHYGVAAAGIAAAACLVLLSPWWETFLLGILLLNFVTGSCLLTRLENWCRRRAGLRPVPDFVGHYLLCGFRVRPPER